MNNKGNFVITWMSGSYDNSYNQDGSYFGVYAQRFDRNGNPVGDEFQVNTYTDDHQMWPSIAMDGVGNFIITWSSAWQIDSNTDVYAQKYDRNSNKIGDEYRVNNYTCASQSNAYSRNIAMSKNGDFIISWGSYNQCRFQYGDWGPAGNDIYAKYYTSRH